MKFQKRRIFFQRTERGLFSMAGAVKRINIYGKSGNLGREKKILLYSLYQ